MSFSVYKYQLKIDDVVEINLPLGAKILRVDVQGKMSVCLWALVDVSEVKTEKHAIRIAGTGHPISEDREIRYINTFTMMDGALWFHAFEIEV